MAKPGKPRSLTGPKRSNNSEFIIEWKESTSYSDKEKGWTSQKAQVFLNGNSKTAKASKSLPKESRKWTYKLNRKQWAPFKGKPKLKSMRFRIIAYHKKESDDLWQGKWHEFKTPKKPSCTFDYDDTTGLLTIACKAPIDDVQDKYDCMYEVTRKDVKTGSSRYGSKAKLALNTNAKALKGVDKHTEFTLMTNVEQVSLVAGSSITFTVKLTSRGFAGNTTTTNSYVIKPPEKVSITKIDISNADGLNLSKNALKLSYTTGTVRVFYGAAKANANYYEKAVTDYVLQRLVTAYDVNKAVEAAVQSGWQQVDTNMGSTSDSAKRSKKKDGIMGEPTIELFTAMGFNNNAHVYDVRVWYRVKSIRQGLPAYSVPVECKELAVAPPTAKNDYSGFMAIKNSTLEPGKSIDGVVGWSNRAKTDEGVDNPQWKDAVWTTVVEWSEHRYATQSNNKPSSLEIDWEYNKPNHDAVKANYTQRVNTGDFGEESKWVDWGKSARFSIYGLTPGVKYYLWTRRHMVLGEYDEYGPRTPAPSGFFPFTPIDNPTTVQVYTEENYIRGQDLFVSWSHNATADQKYWNIYVIQYSANYKEGVSLVSKIKKKLVACGTGKTNSYKVHAGNLNAIIPKCAVGKNDYFTINRKLAIVVGVSTGGKEILSCSDEKGRFIGANYLDIGRIPVGKIAFVPMDVQEYNYTIACNGGKPGTMLKLDYKIKYDPVNDMMNIYLVRVYSSEMTNFTHITYKVTIYRNDKSLRSTNGVLASPIKTRSTKTGMQIQTLSSVNVGISNPSNKVNKVTPSYKIKLQITGGKYYDSQGRDYSINTSKVTKTISKSCYSKTTKIKTESNTRTVYLFSRTNDVTGVINVFSTYDTAYTLPDGEHLQEAGDCVFSRDIATTEFKSVSTSLSLTEKGWFKSIITGDSKYSYVTKVNVYSHRRMLDGSTYTVQAFLRNTLDDSLVSNSMTKSFTHSPIRKAKPCGNTSKAVGTSRKITRPLINKDASAGTILSQYTSPPSPSVSLTIKPPSNYRDTDRYDVYRITSDGGVRIASDRKFDGSKFVDRYAPYSNDKILKYAIVTVTGSGSMAWREINYSLKHTPGIRFDWGAIDNQRAVELPLDVEISDAYTKDVRIDTYLDGSVAAHFNKSIVRKGSNKAKIVKCDFSGIYNDPIKYAVLRDLAKYPGSVFFRADNGTAYECVVEVDGLNEKYDSLTSEVSFKLTEINPPSSRYSSTVSSRETKKFTPKSVGQVPKGTVSAAEKLVPYKGDSVTTKTISTHLLMEYTTIVNKKKVVKTKALSKNSKKIFNDVKIGYYIDTSSTKYSIGFTYLNLDLRKAVDKKLATGIVGKDKNDYRVYLYLKATSKNKTIYEQCWNVGKMNGSSNVRFDFVGKKFTLNREKTNKTVAITSTVYLIKNIQKDSMNYIPLGNSKKKWYSKLSFKKDASPSDNNPEVVKLLFNEVTTYITSNYLNNLKKHKKMIRHRIMVTSLAYNPMKQMGTVYYDSGGMTLPYASKGGWKTSNLGKKAVSFNRPRTGRITVYVHYLVIIGTTLYWSSKKVIVGNFDNVSDIHTSLSSPKTTTITIKHK